MAAASKEQLDSDKEELKKQVFRGCCVQWFLAVVAHTLNLQSEAILIRNACGNDLGKAAQVASFGNAAAGVGGLLVNQIGGKLSDAIGRKPFYFFGPICQLVTGLCCFSKHESVFVLAIFKALKMMGTTFSGTVIGAAAMRDVFEGQELAKRSAEAGSIIGLAIMTGPLLEGFILKQGNPRVTYLFLSALGTVAGLIGLAILPESLSKEKQRTFDASDAVKSLNPFGFLKLYLHGSPAVRKLATITTLQSLIDGKNISDTVQIWVREHVKLSMETIRNFVMGYGFAGFLAGGKLTPYLLKNLSVYGFTTFTNVTNFLGFCMRGSVANIYVFFGALPLMLPGINAASMTALVPVLNKHMTASGFGIGESSAYLNNLRVLAGAVITILYGNVYAWLRQRGWNAGLTFAFGASLGAALPQLILDLTVKNEELDVK